MPWDSRRLSYAERHDLITLEAERQGETRQAITIRAQSARGLDLPSGQRLIFDGSYFLLTPDDGLTRGRR